VNSEHKDTSPVAFYAKHDSIDGNLKIIDYIKPMELNARATTPVESLSKKSAA